MQELINDEIKSDLMWLYISTFPGLLEFVIPVMIYLS